jgi:hypothetical protein
MAALKRIVANEGGVERLKPQMVRETLALYVMLDIPRLLSSSSLLTTHIRADLLHAVTFDEPLHFVENAQPVSRVRARCTGDGNFFAGSPLVLFNDEGFSSLSKFLDAETASLLAAVLQLSFDSIEEVYLASTGHRSTYHKTELRRESSPILDQLADPLANEVNIARIILQSCAVGSRILFRTLKNLSGLDDSANITDMRVLYRNLKFLGLRSWAGLPYIYAWLYVAFVITFWCLNGKLRLDISRLLVGLSAATAQERPFFVGQLARIAASYGGYHLEMLSSKPAPLSYLPHLAARASN